MALPKTFAAIALFVALAVTPSCASDAGQGFLKESPLVTVEVAHRATPEQLDSQVAAVLEQALQPLEGVTDVFAESGEGRVRVRVFCRPGHDPYSAIQSLQEAIQRGRGKLPKEVSAPEVHRGDPEAEPLIWLAFGSKVHAPVELGEVARLVSPRLLAVPGTAEARLVGAAQRRLAVRVDEQRLAAYGVDIVDVLEALARQIAAEPGRVWPSEGLRRLESCVVREAQGRPVPVREVARVELGFPAPEAHVRWSGQAVAALGLLPMRGASLGSWRKKIEEQLAEARAVLPVATQLDLVDLAAETRRRPPLIVDCRIPPGTDSSGAASLFVKAEGRLLEGPAAQLLSVRTGQGASFYLKLKEGANRDTAADQVRRRLAGLPEIAFGVRDVLRSSSVTTGYPVELDLESPDAVKLMEAGQAAAERLKKAACLQDVLFHGFPAGPASDARVRPEAAARLGLAADRIERALRISGSEVPIGHLRAAEGDIAVVVALERAPGGEQTGVRSLRLRTESGAMVSLDQAVQWQVKPSFQFLRRHNGKYTVKISGNPASGLRPADAARRCREEAEAALGAIGASDIRLAVTPDG